MINTIEDLRKLLTLCRSKGVTEITLSGTTIKFGDMPPKTSGKAADEEETESGATDEELLFFSAPKGAEGNQ